MGDFWYRNVVEPGKLPPLLALFAFIATFLITRLITRSIRAGRGPFRDNITAGGTHVHHAVPGLLLLVAGAFSSISVSGSPWLEVAAVAVGVGTSLVLDEFALILHLKDVYWSTEGRVSVELVGLAAATLLFVIIGFVPLGVDHVTIEEFGLRVSLTSSFARYAILVLCCVAKGKYRTALVGSFLPLVAWIPALRLARPGSWWARHRYGATAISRAQVRETAFENRWDPKWEWLGNLIAGLPSR